MRAGETAEVVLLGPDRELSPLGCYIVACRATRPDIVAQFRDQAAEQHWFCPLYRHACAALVAGSLSGSRIRAVDAPSRPVTARDSAVQLELTD